MLVSAQETVLGMVTWRRHLPIWITSGMLLPVGTFSSLKRPWVSVSAVVIGSPDGTASHCTQLAPSGTGSSWAFGT
jgi:hypothetical protein